ncbi:MAG: hypothetical protein ACR2RL_03725 [Gammaproteobacteria bacterium]
MIERFKSTPRAIEVLSKLAGLEVDSSRARQLAKGWSSYQARVERLYEVDVAGFEFDFLHPMERPTQSR